MDELTEMCGAGTDHDAGVLAICRPCHRTEFGYAEYATSRCRCGGVVVVARVWDLLNEGAMWTLFGEMPGEELERLRQEAVQQRAGSTPSA